MNRLMQGYEFLRRTKHAYHNYFTVKALSKTTDFNFTTNYIAGNVENWSHWFAEYREKPAVKFLEVGSFEGRSTIWFLENILTNPTSTITCVDVFWGDGREARFDHNLKRFAKQVIKYKGPSESVLQTLEKELYDIIYIDGSHQSLNVLMDAHLCWKILKTNGLLLFDDYLWELKKPSVERPQLAIDLFLEAYQHKLTIIHKGYQVLVQKL
ncbi:class I SAM-dependent methyltransferase [Runella sp.]|uniref:class I SAM-dependent methyltransferase n=1 Tax=Runella sp. TaxID=1960881 RepID=UPI003D131D49